MKKAFITLALLLTFGLSASAFSFDWGVTAGLNLTKLKFDQEALTSDNRAGWFIGPKVNIGLIGGFGIDGALLYNQRKYYAETEGTSTLQSSQKTARSIEIPINLKYTFGIGKTGVYVATGPQFGFGVGSSSWHLFDNGSTQPGVFSNENMLTTWNVGAGVKLLGHLDVGIGYNFTMGKVGETVLKSTIGDNAIGSSKDYKANTFFVQVAYYF